MKNIDWNKYFAMGIGLALLIVVLVGGYALTNYPTTLSEENTLANILYTDLAFLICMLVGFGCSGGDNNEPKTS